MRRNDLVIRGAIRAGRGVGLGRARALEHLVVVATEALGRALEQVLEQVGEAGAVRSLVGRADAIPDADADLRRRGILVDHELEAARERPPARREVGKPILEVDRRGHSVGSGVRWSDSAS